MEGDLGIYVTCELFLAITILVEPKGFAQSYAKPYFSKNWQVL